MDVTSIAGMASMMKMFHLQTEASARVLNMLEDSAAELAKAVAAMTGIGQNIDITV
ncbi:MAG: hypothetical protein FWH04_00860 [Oscillospiraceae bacterium]|nr:hypothetical protein [Oscillospiraceae bacterium]